MTTCVAIRCNNNLDRQRKCFLARKIGIKEEKILATFKLLREINVKMAQKVAKILQDKVCLTV